MFSFLHTKQDQVEFLQNLRDFRLQGGDKIKYFTSDEIRVVDKYLSKQVGLKRLEQDLVALPVIFLSLVFNPTISQIGDLSLWFEKNLGKKIILDIDQDYSILGGVIVGIEGRQWDYAIR